MHPIAWLAAAVAGLFVIDAKVKPLGLAKYNPLGSGTTLLKPKTDEKPGDINPAITPSKPVPSVIPSTVPGILVVDGHGTGVLPEGPRLPNMPSGFPGFPSFPGNAPTKDSVMDAATRAANDMQLQLIDAMNTAEGDRTPEQLALLATIAQLPTL